MAEHAQLAHTGNSVTIQSSQKGLKAGTRKGPGTPSVDKTDARPETAATPKPLNRPNTNIQHDEAHSHHRSDPGLVVPLLLLCRNMTARLINVLE